MELKGRNDGVQNAASRTWQTENCLEQADVWKVACKGYGRNDQYGREKYARIQLECGRYTDLV
jgi:hypothetical protein